MLDKLHSVCAQRLVRSDYTCLAGPLDTVMPSEDLGQILVGQLHTGALYALPASYYDFDLAGPEAVPSAHSSLCSADNDSCRSSTPQVHCTQRYLLRTCVAFRFVVGTAVITSECCPGPDGSCCGARGEPRRSASWSEARHARSQCGNTGADGVVDHIQYKPYLSMRAAVYFWLRSAGCSESTLIPELQQSHAS